MSHRAKAKPRPVGRRFAKTTVALLAALGLLASVASADARPTSEVLDDLKELDQSLEKLIKEEKSEGVKYKELADRVDRLHTKKYGIASRFDKTKHNLAFKDVFGYLDCVDRELGYAKGVQQAAGKDPAEGRHKDSILDHVQVARNCAGNLSDRLGGQAPEAFAKGIQKLKTKLTEIKDGVKEEKLNRDELESKIKEVTRLKQGMVDGVFGGEYKWGVELADVYHRLDCVDRLMGEAVGVQEGEGKDLSKRKKVADLLNRAQNCVDDFDKTFRTALAEPLKISPIKAVFNEASRATTYSLTSVEAVPGVKLKYEWALSLEAVDPNKPVDQGCNNHGVLTGTAGTFVWHHGNTGDTIDDGCDHSKTGKYGHQGLITIEVTDDRGWKCTAAYRGSNSSTATSVADGVATAPDCRRP